VELQLLTLLGPFYLGSIGTGIGSSLGAGGAAGLGYMRPSLNIFLHSLIKKEPIKMELIKAVGGGKKAILFMKVFPSIKEEEEALIGRPRRSSLNH